MNADLQSMLSPAGTGAALAGELGTLMYIVLGLVFAGVIALTAYVVATKPGTVDNRWWIIGGGVVLPVVVLGVLLVRSFGVSAGLQAEAPTDAQRIRVTGHQWWWDVRYETPGGDVVLANELRLPVGEPVVIELGTADVIHSFWVPSLAGKVDMLPGRRTHLTLLPTVPGIFRGQCAEFCGLQHAWMAFFVVVEDAADFRAWLAAQAAPAAEPADEFLRRGQRAFFTAGCDECHTIRGTAARGNRGPDLTHVGSRQSLGAGVLSNHVGPMAGRMGGWIGGAQDLKPGNRMPSDNTLAGADLRAVADWLSSLK